MNHRSLIFDLFGGYVRYDGGVITLQDLAAMTELFGVGPDALRVVMSRLRREGWFEVTRLGGRARYRATDKTWSLLDEGYKRIFGSIGADTWDGQWYIAIYEIPERDRAVREQLRRQLTWLGFGSLAPSVWFNPRNRLQEAKDYAANHSSVRLDTLVAHSSDEEQDLDYVRRCWDLDAIAQRYRLFLDTYGSKEAIAHWRDAQGADALVARVNLAHDYRTALFGDPRIPGHLLPADWPGKQAPELFIEAYERLELEANRAYGARRTWVPSIDAQT